ncbi:MAG: hypothetical protein HY393_01170 [Candidatus Diapherotrites archaeon]|nr:hypothetical protein [Candidatus Diapherotrites archaeon]
MARGGTKVLKREVKTIRKALKKERSAVKRTAIKTKQLSGALGKLKKEMGVLRKKKTPKRELNLYNVFMRNQLRQGKTFSQSVKLWKRSRKVLLNPARYKAVTPAALARRRKPVVKVKVRRIVKKVPVIRTRVRTRIVEKKVPVVRTKRVIQRVPVVRTKVVQAPRQSPTELAQAIAKALDHSKSLSATGPMHVSTVQVSEEELALKIVHLFFEEVARTGFKRTLTLDAMINAYFYTLGRLKNKSKEMAIVSKLVEKAEADLAQESKEMVTQQGPVMQAAP